MTDMVEGFRLIESNPQSLLVGGSRLLEGKLESLEVTRSQVFGSMDIGFIVFIEIKFIGSNMAEAGGSILAS